MSGYVVAIPARHDASRLPGKPLRLLGGEPLVLHAARRALESGADEVWVAVDDARVADALQASGVRIAMTAPDHASGSDRLAECAAIAGWDDDTVVVNLQGDEPFAPAAGIRAVAGILARGDAPMGTLAARIADARELLDPDTVKVVRAANGDALYFSRAPVPWPRDAFARERSVLPAEGEWLRHIGIYAYRAGFLKRFAGLPRGVLERLESLEQLRALEHGFRIEVALSPVPFPPGVDNEDDLVRARQQLAAAGG